MRIIFYLLHIVIITVIGITSFHVSTELSLVKIDSLFNSIITISAIIFGVLGAWVGLLKKEIENSNLDQTIDREERQIQVERLSSLIQPLTLSCLMICICIIYNFLSATLPHIPFYVEYADILKLAALFVFGTVSYLQVASILRLAITGIDTLIDMQQLSDKVSEEVDR
jgi:hypothetical protein